MEGRKGEGKSPDGEGGGRDRGRVGMREGWSEGKNEE